MQRVFRSAALLAVMAWPALYAAPALAQRPPGANPPPHANTPAAAAGSIDITYVTPGDPRLRAVAERVKQRKVLEQLQLFLSPLQLPKRLAVRFDQCGGSLVKPYQPGGPVTLCYEYVEQIETYAPFEANIIVGPGLSTRENQGYLRRDDLLVGPVVMVALHEVALAAFDLLQIPVWGNLDESADRVAGFIMTRFGRDVAWKTLMSVAWYISQTSITGIGIDFSYVRTSGAHSFYNYLCMAYGSDPQAFAFLTRNLDIPGNRKDWCAYDFQQVRYAFDTTILPHVNQDQLRKVQAIQWLAPAR
jgi:hypothetical protein